VTSFRVTPPDLADKLKYYPVHRRAAFSSTPLQGIETLLCQIGIRHKEEEHTFDELRGQPVRDRSLLGLGTRRSNVSDQTPQPPPSRETADLSEGQRGFYPMDVAPAVPSPSAQTAPSASGDAPSAQAAPSQAEGPADFDG
jgi:hypothetical protein